MPPMNSTNATGIWRDREIIYISPATIVDHDCPGHLSIASGVWAMIAIAANTMSQPSGRVLGYPSEYNWALRSSPIVCLVNTVDTLIRLAIYSIKQKSLKLGLRNLVNYRFKDRAGEGDGSLSSLRNNTVFRAILFGLGAVPQAVKLFATKGALFPQVCCTIFLTSFVIDEILRFGSPSPEREHVDSEQVESSGIRTTRWYEDLEGYDWRDLFRGCVWYHIVYFLVPGTELLTPTLREPTSRYTRYEIFCSVVVWTGLLFPMVSLTNNYVWIIVLVPEYTRLMMITWIWVNMYNSNKFFIFSASEIDALPRADKPVAISAANKAICYLVVVTGGAFAIRHNVDSTKQPAAVYLMCLLLATILGVTSLISKFRIGRKPRCKNGYLTMTAACFYPYLNFGALAWYLVFPFESDMTCRPSWTNDLG